MKKNDVIFGELEFDFFWSKDIDVNFMGKEVEITLIIKGDEDGEFEEEQYIAYTAFVQSWEKLQQTILQYILEYYQQIRQQLGYDIEVNENYPLVKTTEQILEMIDIDGIVIPYGDIFDGRDIGMTFNCSWDSENGLGLRLLNEQVVGGGYQDIVI